MKEPETDGAMTKYECVENWIVQGMESGRLQEIERSGVSIVLIGFDHVGKLEEVRSRLTESCAAIRSQ